MGAYKLLGKAKDRQEWLRWRQRGIGGSDAGAILGINTHKRAEQVFEEKLDPQPIERSNDAMRFGTVFEPYVMELLSEHYPEAQLAAGDPWGTIQSEERPWQLANIDGLLLQDRQPAGVGLEIKTCSASMHRLWRVGVPAAYFAQVQHYMSVLGWERFDLWLCVASHDRTRLLRRVEAAPCPDTAARQIVMGCVLERYTIRRHDDFIERLNRAEERFWERVLRARERQGPAQLELLAP